MPATGAMAAPAIPRRWMCSAFVLARVKCVVPQKIKLRAPDGCQRTKTKINPAARCPSQLRASPRATNPVKIAGNMLVLRKSTRTGRLQNFELALAIRRQTRLNTEWKREHRPGCVTDRRAEHDRNPQRRQNAPGHIFHALGSLRRIALRKIPEDDTRNFAELAGLLQMHQCSIHLPGLHRAVFENQNRAACIELPLSPNRGLDQVQAAAKQRALD